MQTPPLPPDPEQQDHLLEDLAAATGLFNPERIWQQEEQLDELDQKEEEGQDTRQPAD